MNVKSIPAALVTVATCLFLFCPTAAAQPYTLEISRDPEDGGAYHVEPDQETYAADTMITVTAIAFPGYQFVGWEGNITASADQLVFPIAANTSLTAMFEAAAEVTAEFHIVVVSEPQETGYVTLEPGQTTYSTDDEVTLTAIPLDGYVFASWSGDVPDDADLEQAELQLIVDDDLEITANFEAAAGVSTSSNGDVNNTTSQGSGICGALGLLFWPATILGLAAIRRR